MTSTKQMEVIASVIASKEKRFLNYIIDYALFYVVILAVAVLLGFIAYLLNSDTIIEFLFYLENINSVIDYLVTALIMSLFYFLFEATTQRTIGKFITGTKVVMLDGSKPSPETIVKRSLSRAIPFNVLSFLGKRGWHDSISNTYVIDVKKYNDLTILKTELEDLGKETN